MAEGRVIELECGCLERTNVGALAGVVEVKRGGCATHGPSESSPDERAARALEAELLARLLELRQRVEQCRDTGLRSPVDGRRFAIALTKLEELELWTLRALGRT